MKKLFVILFAVIALFVTACIENEVPTKNESIKLNLKVEPFDVGTKAMKTGWAVGDKLNIWFNHINFSHSDPDLIITYAGNNQWTAGSLREGVVPESSGKMHILYEGFNNLDSYSYSNEYDMFLDKNVNFYKKGKRKVNEEDVYSYCTPVVVYKNNVDYSFNNNTLSSEISSWQIGSNFVILVEGIDPSVADKCQLKAVYTSMSGSSFLSSMETITTTVYDEEGGGVGVRSAFPATGWTGGVPSVDGDGVVFYYYFVGTIVEDERISFTLKEYNEDESIKSTKTYTKSFPQDYSLAIQTNKFTGVKVAYSKFN